MSTITLYTFEGNNAPDTTTTDDPTEAQRIGTEWRCKVIANEYEWSDSEVAWDFTEPEPCEWFLHNGRPTREWCCNTHRYSGGDAGVEGEDHPVTCPAADFDPDA